MKKKGVAVIGPGALGILFAVYFSKAGYSVVLVDYRKKRAEELGQFGLEVRGPKGIIRESVQLCTYDELREKQEQYFGRTEGAGPLFWLVCVKAHSLSPVAKELAPMGEALVVAIQNGLDSRKKLEEFLPRERILVGSTPMGARLVQQGKVQFGGAGRIFLDGGHPQGPEVAGHFRQGGFQVELAPCMEEVLWEKALLNSALNPLTAVLQIPNGRVVEDEALRKVFQEMLKEGLSVAHACGRLEDMSFEELWSRAQEILISTRENLSSMAQDLRQGRKTEIESINGILVEQGRKKGLSVPLLQAFSLLVAFEEKRGQKKKEEV